MRKCYIKAEFCIYFCNLIIIKEFINLENSGSICEARTRRTDGLFATKKYAYS